MHVLRSRQASDSGSQLAFITRVLSISASYIICARLVASFAARVAHGPQFGEGFVVFTTNDMSKVLSGMERRKKSPWILTSSCTLL